MALTKKSAAPEAEQNKAVAFVNWSIPTSDGKSIRSSKGFPIFQNPKYPNRQEDLLIALAKKHGGSVSVTMEVKIMLNNSQPVEAVDLDNIIVHAAPTEVPSIPLQ